MRLAACLLCQGSTEETAYGQIGTRDQSHQTVLLRGFGTEAGNVLDDPFRPLGVKDAMKGGPILPGQYIRDPQRRRRGRCEGSAQRGFEIADGVEVLSAMKSRVRCAGCELTRAVTASAVSLGRWGSARRQGSSRRFPL